MEIVFCIVAMLLCGAASLYSFRYKFYKLGFINAGLMVVNYALVMFIIYGPKI